MRRHERNRVWKENLWTTWEDMDDDVVIHAAPKFDPELKNFERLS